MSVRPRKAPSANPLFDPGWLFLGAGLLLMASGVLIPAGDDLARALWRRDRVLHAELHRLERLTRYEIYLDRVERRDPIVVQNLAQTQLGLTPAGSAVVLLTADGEGPDASVFASLEPDPLVLPEAPTGSSLLARLATGERSRLWLLAASAMLVLIGLLPASCGDQDAGEDPDS